MACPAYGSVSGVRDGDADAPGCCSDGKTDKPILFVTSRSGLPPQTPASDTPFALRSCRAVWRDNPVGHSDRQAEGQSPNLHLAKLQFITLGAGTGGRLFLAIIAVAMNSKPTSTTNGLASEKRAEKQADGQGDKDEFGQERREEWSVLPCTGKFRQLFRNTTAD